MTDRRERAKADVVIVGAGFGGLYAARQLEDSGLSVTLIDRKNHHTFQPLLYQVATAALNPADIASPIRSILRDQKNVRVVLGDVTSIDRTNRRVVYAGGSVDYDYLIVATGATHSYFGHDEWARISPGLKTVEDAVEIRRRILLAFEAAEQETDEWKRSEFLTFVIVGAGPTGVELAGSLSEIARHTIIRDFRTIERADTRVILVEATPHVLPQYDEKLSASAKRQLEKIGVEVMTGIPVNDIREDRVVLEGGGVIHTRTVLWAAGVRASSLARSLDTELDKAGRVVVTETLNIPGDPRVFVVGDLARVEHDGETVPGVAPAAIQEGRHAAANIERASRGEQPEKFTYRDKGMLATIGRAAAVAKIGKFSFDGFPAWIVWLAVHIATLIGFRNRILVLIGWAWAYISWTRGSRLITDVVRSAELVAEPPEEQIEKGSEEE
ncbi:MAG: NAD(P)/FAD-dependent oxidoreductase [Acidobacteria bacterium]|nr:NAD(P)/FAD-dependent oxidoreductase [Acidobacteriota bacterium]